MSLQISTGGKTNLLLSYLLFLLLQEDGWDPTDILLGAGEKIPQLLHKDAGIFAVQKSSEVHLHVFRIGELGVFEEVEDKFNHNVIVNPKQLVHTCCDPWLDGVEVYLAHIDLHNVDTIH